MRYHTCKSFLQKDPTQLLQSFNTLPDHQTGINRGLTHPTQLDREVNQISQALQAQMVDMASDPAIMLNYKSEAADVPTIDLTGEEANIHYPPLRGNIAWDPEDDLDAPTAEYSCSIHQHGICDESFSSVAPSHTGSAEASAEPSTSVLRGIPMASLVIDKKTFSSKSNDRVKALMSKENRTQTLIKVWTEEAATHFDATSQDKESYDGDVSKIDEEDAEVIPNKEDDIQIKYLKPAGDDTLSDNEGQEETNKEDGDQTAKPGDKKLV